MKPLGMILIVIGLIGLLYGGMSWTRKDKVVDAGPIEITADKHERLRFRRSPAASCSWPACSCS